MADLSVTNSTGAATAHWRLPGSSVQVSEREIVQRELADFLTANAAIFDAPYGVLLGRHADGKRSYRSITFGKAGTLDAEIRIYSPAWFLLRASDYTYTVFHSLNELLAHLALTYLPRPKAPR